MISRPNRTFRSRAVRPTLEGLEARELLSMMVPLPVTEVHALHTRTHVSTIAQLSMASPTTASTVPPANGDVNPYGVAFVPPGFPTGGCSKPGDVLVSNFNNSLNQQGTGTTIVDISPNGSQSLFFQDSSAPGLDTALGVLKRGFVIVGNLPGTYDSNGNLLHVRSRLPPDPGQERQRRDNAERFPAP